MSVLEQVMWLKNQGRNDTEVINYLQQQGISPKEIKDSLNQAQIKSAITEGNTEDMQPSIMQQEYEPEEPPVPSPIPDQPRKPKERREESFYPQQQAQYSQPQYQQPYQQPYQEQDYPQQQEQQMQDYQPEYYSGYEDQQQPYDNQGNYSGGYEGYSGGAGVDTDTLIEIAEQVFAEKIKKLQKQLDDINEFKILTETRVEHFSTRLKRIEDVIDKLEVAIIDKVGSYGNALSSIKKEMSMMQDSFSKVAEKALKHHTPIEHSEPSHSPHKTSKKK